MSHTRQAASYTCQGIRGAITVEANTRDAILGATHELLSTIVEANTLDPDDIGAVFFTTTADLTAEYPAVAAREMGWHDAAIMCSHEMNVPHGLARCLRVLILWNTTRTTREIQHVYLRGAAVLRPDRTLS